MNKYEAIEAMKNGKTLTHTYFSKDEWVKLSDNKNKYIFEDGCLCPIEEFWKYRSDTSFQTGWSIK